VLTAAGACDWSQTLSPCSQAPTLKQYSVEVAQALKAIRAARDSAVMSAAELSTSGRRGHDDWVGETGIDVRAVRGDGPGEVSAEIVAACVGKHATKLSGGLGLPARRIDNDHDIDA